MRKNIHHFRSQLVCFYLHHYVAFTFLGEMMNKLGHVYHFLHAIMF